MAVLIFLVSWEDVLAYIDKAATHFTTWERLIRYIGYCLFAIFIAACVYGLVWLNNRPPKSLPPPKQLPTKLNSPSAFDADVWTEYGFDSNTKTSLSMVLPTKKSGDGSVSVWEKDDNTKTGETDLWLTTYDCELGTEQYKYDISYKHGVYIGFDEFNSDQDELGSEKIEIGTVGGDAFLLACYGKMPSNKRIQTN